MHLIQQKQNKETKNRIFSVFDLVSTKKKKIKTNKNMYCKSSDTARRHTSCELTSIYLAYKVNKKIIWLELWIKQLPRKRHKFVPKTNVGFWLGRPNPKKSQPKQDPKVPKPTQRFRKLFKILGLLGLIQPKSHFFFGKNVYS